jgi:hypothetical protein
MLGKHGDFFTPGTQGVIRFNQLNNTRYTYKRILLILRRIYFGNINIGWIIVSRELHRYFI